MPPPKEALPIRADLKRPRSLEEVESPNKKHHGDQASDTRPSKAGPSNPNTKPSQHKQEKISNKDEVDKLYEGSETIPQETSPFLNKMNLILSNLEKLEPKPSEADIKDALGKGIFYNILKKERHSSMKSPQTKDDYTKLIQSIIDRYSAINTKKPKEPKTTASNKAHSQIIRDYIPGLGKLPEDASIEAILKVLSENMLKILAKEYDDNHTVSLVKEFGIEGLTMEFVLKDICRLNQRKTNEKAKKKQKPIESDKPYEKQPLAGPSSTTIFIDKDKKGKIPRGDESDESAGDKSSGYKPDDDEVDELIGSDELDELDEKQPLAGPSSTTIFIDKDKKGKIPRGDESDESAGDKSSGYKPNDDEVDELMGSDELDESGEEQPSIAGPSSTTIFRKLKHKTDLWSIFPEISSRTISNHKGSILKHLTEAYPNLNIPRISGKKHDPNTIFKELQEKKVPVEGLKSAIIKIGGRDGKIGDQLWNEIITRHPEQKIKQIITSIYPGKLQEDPETPPQTGTSNSPASKDHLYDDRTIDEDYD